MTLDYKFGKMDPKRVIRLEEPGKFLPFDVDRRFIEAVSKQCNIRAFIEGLKGKAAKEVQAALKSFGRESMKMTIDLANGDFKDRAGEMIEKVAKQTGISFPHRLERYVELWLITSRPEDRWTIDIATRQELKVDVTNCVINKLISQGGLGWKGDFPCLNLCTSAFETAAAKTGDRLKIETKRTTGEHGTCAFRFMLQA